MNLRGWGGSLSTYHLHRAPSAAFAISGGRAPSFQQVRCKPWCPLDLSFLLDLAQLSSSAHTAENLPTRYRSAIQAHCRCLSRRCPPPIYPASSPDPTDHPLHVSPHSPPQLTQPVPPAGLTIRLNTQCGLGGRLTSLPCPLVLLLWPFWCPLFSEHTRLSWSSPHLWGQRMLPRDGAGH